MLGRIKGDKVVWMVVLLLFMISMITITGSTSLLALTDDSSRISLMTRHIWICTAGFVLILICYAIPSIKIFEKLSMLGFALSLILLAALHSHFHISSNFHAGHINGAWRTIHIFGFQLHIFEVVKVAMVMYIAWACKTLKEDKFLIAAKLAGITTASGRKPFAFMETGIAKTLTYILIPIAMVSIMVIPGSNSSGIFITLVMIATAVVGGLDFRYIIVLAATALAAFGVMYGINRLTDGKKCQRVATLISRANPPDIDDLFRIEKESGKKSKRYAEAFMKIQQPYSAKIAIHEGGLFRKGIGGSTQKYVVPVMYSDFIYAYILEESGFLGGIAIIILYLSLVSRGTIIVRNCPDKFGQTAVGGLILLIVGQAFMHIFINLGIFPLTGQTLPIISHGSGSFLCFSVAFGIILSISKMSWEKTVQEEQAAENGVWNSTSTYSSDF